MKKVLIFLLAAIFVVTGVLLVACQKQVTDIKINGAPDEVTRGENIDYSKITIVVTYEDGSTQTLKLTDKGVTYDRVDTSTVGSKTLSVRYGGKSQQVRITVVEGTISDSVQVTEYSNEGSGYASYLNAIKEQSNKETEFVNRNVNYKVGTDNGYVFLPHVTVLDENGDEIVLQDVETTYKLFEKNADAFVEVSADQVSQYISKVENNVYYFTADALGKTFKLEVTLSDKYELLDQDTSTTVSREFDVVEGYNVYDALGLSVLDNLSVKSWADLKKVQLDWDSKPLSEYTDVKQVILHNDITVTAEFLPDNYFWQENEAAKVVDDHVGSVSYQSALATLPENYKPLLKGSLKEAFLGEQYEITDGLDNQQRGLYTSNGIGLSGNFLRLSYETGLVYDQQGNVDTTQLPSKGIYVVYDWSEKAESQNYPEPHTSLIAMTHAIEGTAEEGIIGTRTIENVYFVGQTKKTEHYEGQPAGLMMMTSDMSKVKIVNAISTDWFCDATLDGVGVGEITIDSCKFYNSFSQMIFSWGIVNIDIRNSEMKDAGGPIIIMQTITLGTERSTVLTVDDESQMESWVTGNEAWFQINMGGSASVVSQLLQMATAVDYVGGTHYMRRNGDMQQANLVAIVIPDAGDVMTNQHAIPGTVNVGDSTYAMRDSVFETLANLNSIATQAADNVNGAMTLLNMAGQDTATVEQLKAGFDLLAAGTVDLQVAPIYQSGNTYAYFDGEKPVSLNANDLLANVKQLYAGTQTLIDGLSGNPMTSAIVGQLQTNVIDKLAPLAQLEVNEDTWAQSWTEDTLAVWVNPGGTKTPYDYTLKHFMIMLGEDTQPAA